MICPRCTIDKPEGEFPIKRLTGLRGELCRPCCARTTASAWAKRNPDRKSAHYYVAKALKDGKLTRPNVCQKCGAETYTIAHHPDYSKPLKVVWLCDSCHKTLHVRRPKKIK